jgi:glycosyltransferase involved in cell wall biosynthesis
MRQTTAPLYEVPMQGRLDLHPAWHLARVVRREGYRLIHTHTARSAVIGSLASLATGVPMVHHVHSPATSDTTHRWRNWMNGLTERIVLHRAAALVAVSESLGQYVVRQGFAREKVFVVPNGVPCRRPVPVRDPAKATWTLGTLALFRPRKGIEVLIEALAALHAQGHVVRLRAVGQFETPEYERRIKGLAESLGVGHLIDWVGFARDVDRELAQMDLFVLPSLFGEGLPMVVLEAMSAGLPVVATRVAGVPEAVRDGQEGLLTEPGDCQDLARALGRFLSGEIDWHAMRARALQRHAERFSESRMAAGVAEVYERVLTDRARAGR